MRYAVQAAHDVDEVKDIRDKAQAMAAYAKQANDTELLGWVTEIKVRAERKAGELTREIDRRPGIRTSSHDATRSKEKVLASLGISKQTANRWEKLAAVPETQFEQAIAAAKEVAGVVTTAAMLRANREPKPVKPKAKNLPPQEAEESNLADELERADKEIRGLQALVESLQKSDLAKEVVSWQTKFNRLEGRLRQCMTTSKVAEKQATYSSGLLAKIRSTLKVQKNAEILPALSKA